MIIYKSTLSKYSANITHTNRQIRKSLINYEYHDDYKSVRNQKQ